MVILPMLTAELDGKFSHWIVTELPEAIVNPDRYPPWKEIKQIN